MATFYPYPTASHFDRDHYAPHRTQQQQWHNSFQSNYDYDEQPAWSGALSNGHSQAGSSSASCSYSLSSAVMTTPRSIYPVDAVYGELDFCRSPSNSSGSSLPASHEDQFMFPEDSSPTSTRPVTATTQDDDMITDENSVVVKQEDDASCFIMELSAPQAQSTLVSQSLAPPIEVPLRATHASRKMRSMMSSFRCNPFAMHAGGDSAMAPDREEAKPHEEEPLMFEFQIDGYIHDCPFDCDTDLLTLSMSCDTDEKKRPTLPKESLRAFSPSFELHSDSASAFGISSETELDPAASASSASVSDHAGSEWGDNDLEGPASASSYAPSERPSSLSHSRTHDHDHARGRGLAQARLIKPSTARAQSWDLHHTSSTSKMLTGSQANAASYQDYQSDDNATAPHPNIPTTAASGLHFRVPHTPTPPPTSTRPSSTVTNGRKRSHDDMTKGQASPPVNLTGPGRNASYPRRSHQRTGSASSFGTSQSFYSEPSPLTSSPASPIIGATAVSVPSHSGHPSHVPAASQFSSRPHIASYGVHAAGDSNSAALTPTAQWSPQPRSNNLHYSAAGIPCHTVGMPMNLAPRSCVTALNATAVGAGLSNTNISTLPPLTSAHRRWSLPDNISTSHPQSYQAHFLA